MQINGNRPYESKIKIGDKFGNLTVVRSGQQSRYRKSWDVLCDCGKEFRVGELDLMPRKKNGRAKKSCGCRNYAHDGLIMKHKRLYQTWYSMKKRCENPSKDNYDRYGGKGIKVCNEWSNSFEAFVEWSLQNGYTDELTIDRIDHNGDYEPSNCRFITLARQAHNKGIARNNKSGYTGVRFNDKTGNYNIMITRNGKSYNLGTVDEFQKAVEERKRAEQHFEEHLTLENFVPAYKRYRTNN